MQERYVRKISQQYTGRLEFIYLSGLSMDELLQKVSRLPADTIALYLSVFRDAKGEKVRTVDIELKMSEYIVNFVRLYRKDANPNEYLIINERGKPISYMSIYSKVRRIGEKAKIGRIHPHTLRCTYLVRLFFNKKDLRYVQEQAGHTSKKITALYAKMANKLLQDEGTFDSVSPSAKETVVFQDEIISAECTSQKTINQKQSYDLDESDETTICEACNNQISAGNGSKIDSGQILCDDCLKELRSKYPSNNS